jgi:type III pantothenate kinase
MIAKAAQLMPLARPPSGVLSEPLARPPGGALYPVALDKHSPVVGYDTETAVRSGVLHGFASQVDGMVARIFEERQIRPPFTVVATGGNASYLTGRARLITHQRPRLTLEGLRDLAKKV